MYKGKALPSYVTISLTLVLNRGSKHNIKRITVSMEVCGEKFGARGAGAGFTALLINLEIKVFHTMPEDS